MTISDGTQGILGETVGGAQLDTTLGWHGTVLPTSPTNDIPVNGLFLLTAVDGSNTPGWYENTGTKAAPVFVLRTATGGRVGDQLHTLSTTIGDYSSPTNADASSDSAQVDNGRDGSSTSGWQSNVWVVKFTGLTVGQKYSHVGIKVVTAVGSVRVKVYDDSADAPTNLLGESGSIVVPGTGIQYFQLTSLVTVPSDGILYAGFEVTASTLNLNFDSPFTDERRSVTHTFGAGPDPFGAQTKNNQPPWVALASFGTLIDNDTATNFQTNSENNPFVVVDIGSLQNIVALAVNLDRTATTETEIDIRTSIDSTFTASEDVRSLLITDFTDDTYRFIMLPRAAKNRQFIQIRGVNNSVILSINEIKFRAASDANAAHFHKFLDPTKTGDNSEDSN